MHVRIIAVGNIREVFWENAIAEYEKRLTPFCKFEIIEIKESTPGEEAAEIKKKLKGPTVLFDVSGHLVTSADVSTLINGYMQNGGQVTFIIGGSDGVGPYLYDVVDEKISFGRVTMPHQLFRVVAVEQIYRAFTILNNKKYHK